MARTSLGDFESPFEAAVAEQLRQKGWNLQPQIGVSGFRVDLGVVDPDAPGIFLAGIECDGATYHSGATARDRDRLRQVVLEGLGWRILRIWSTDWWTNAPRETQRVHQALEVALTEVRGERAKRDAEAAAAAEIAIPVAENVEPEEPQIAPGLADRSNLLLTDVDAVDAANFYQDNYREQLSRIIRQTIEEVAPVREDRLIQRVARAHGFQRAGREIRERVLALLPSDCARTQEPVGNFIWPSGIEPVAWDRFRSSAAGAAIDPADLPIQELVALAGSLTTAVVSDEAALLAMRVACGLGRLSEATRTRFLQALGEARLKQALPAL